MDPGAPRFLDERAQSRDVVLKAVFGIDQHHIGHLVEGLRDGDPTLAAANDHDARRLTV
jgi:hypothetical protein